LNPLDVRKGEQLHSLPWQVSQGIGAEWEEQQQTCGQRKERTTTRTQGKKNQGEHEQMIGSHRGDLPQFAPDDGG
jgi:hypothetical protein